MTTFGAQRLSVRRTPVGAERRRHAPRGWRRSRLGVKQQLRFYIRKAPDVIDIRGSYVKVAATYSPTWWGSTIGDGELNFSVRNGKRWILTAITATVCF